MYTATSKAVLSPLADAVTSLILIISESEIHKTPMPDLSNLASAVDDQIKNLVNVASRSLNSPSSDERLRREMPEACEIGE
jgi:hypothetical protein